MGLLFGTGNGNSLTDEGVGRVGMVSGCMKMPGGVDAFIEDKSKIVRARR
jgi:hypothetical protein